LRAPAFLQEQARARLQRTANAVEISERVAYRDGEMHDVGGPYALSDDGGIDGGNRRVVDVKDALRVPGRAGSDGNLQRIKITAAGDRRSWIDFGTGSPALESRVPVDLRGARKDHVRRASPQT